MKTPKKRTLTSRLFSGSGWAIFTMFVWEMVEEGLENLIAVALSSAVALFVTKALSTLAIITATQGIKVAIKRFMTPLIRELTYKEGNDKMKKLKDFFAWVNANKCTIGGVVISALTVISGAGVIDVNSLPTLVIGTFNITPVIYYLLLGVMGIVVSFFPESVKKYTERIARQKAEKEAKIIEKEAKKEIANEEKIANQTQAEAEKAKAKAEAQERAKAEKEKLEAEHRAKVEEVKARLKEQNTESTGD